MPARDSNLLLPIHHSVPLGGVRPHGMTLKRLTQDESRFLQQQAIGIFIAMTNAGRTFQDALAAIYLSGIEHGVSGANK